MKARRLVEELRSFMEANSYSQSDLSRLTGVPQPTISRALRNPIRITRTHRALCKFARIAVEAPSPTPRRGQEALIQAVLDVWDGTQEHADSIARLLQAGATLEALGASRVLKNRKHHGDR